MENLYDKIKGVPAYFKQISLNEQLITQYECPLDKKKFPCWTQHGYFVYVLEGKKIWHTTGASVEMTQGRCLFVKKGAHIVEQFFDARFCVILLFLSDQFISKIIRLYLKDQLSVSKIRSNSIFIPVNTDDSIHAYFNSVLPFFTSKNETNSDLLELKFKELILTTINDPANFELKNYFLSLVTDTPTENLAKVMEENFCFNLSLNEFATICGRSLSTFKRDFENTFSTTPGKWLLNKRLQYSEILIRSTAKTISEIAFESGFENSSHFSRSFREYFKLSPSDYRKSKEAAGQNV